MGFITWNTCDFIIYDYRNLRTVWKNILWLKRDFFEKQRKSLLFCGAAWDTCGEFKIMKESIIPVWSANDRSSNERIACRNCTPLEPLRCTGGFATLWTDIVKATLPHCLLTVFHSASKFHFISECAQLWGLHSRHSPFFVKEKSVHIHISNKQ